MHERATGVITFKYLKTDIFKAFCEAGEDIVPNSFDSAKSEDIEARINIFPFLQQTDEYSADMYSSLMNGARRIVINELFELYHKDAPASIGNTYLPEAYFRIYDSTKYKDEQVDFLDSHIKKMMITVALLGWFKNKGALDIAEKLAKETAEELQKGAPIIREMIQMYNRKSVANPFSIVSVDVEVPDADFTDYVWSSVEGSRLVIQY